MNVLRRIWRGIVAAMAGGVLSVVVQMMGQMTIGLSIDSLPWILAACAGGGFLLGLSLPLRRTRAKAVPSGHDHTSAGAMRSLMLCFVLGAVVLAGCSGKPVGSNITSIYSTGFVCSGIEHAKMPFDQTRIISGVIIRDGSLLQSAADLTNSLRRSFVLINNRFLGGLVAGEYWQLQGNSNILAGSPMMDTRPSKITFLQIDTQNVITNVQEIKVAYVTIAVDPADFGRPFTGYMGSQ